jgi:NAD(P)-dependent dehydrogenase (short-subunit alcohol dehydrogenase family)
VGRRRELTARRKPITDPILIFGASGGIGSATARRLRTGGYPLHLTARDAGRLGTLAAELEAGMTPGDVLEEDDLARAVAAASSATGALGGVVFAVGSIELAPLRRTTADQFAAAFALNVTAAALAVKHAQLPLAKGMGSVVLFSSVAGDFGFRNHAVIGSAKAAVAGLTRSLAAELAPRTRVNAVAPSLTRTPLAGPLLGNVAMTEALEKQHPLGRLGAADDVAALVVALLGDAGRHVTGQVIGVDGGRGRIAG